MSAVDLASIGITIVCVKFNSNHVLFFCASVCWFAVLVCGNSVCSAMAPIEKTKDGYDYDFVVIGGGSGGLASAKEGMVTEQQ